MKKILVIDNYDSFTYNLVHYIASLTGGRPDVFRNNEIGLDRVNSYDKILISPGPGIPSEAGICLDLIIKYSKTKSILGVCLGHQAIGEAFGGCLSNLSTVFHGIATQISITDPDDPLFKGIPDNFIAGRYHSWIIEEKNLPGCLKITCTEANHLIMGISHREFDVRGVQFHPESVLTEFGYDIIRNWIYS